MHAGVDVCVCMYVMCVCMYVCMYVSMYVCMHGTREEGGLDCMHAGGGVMYVCMCICMYVCMHACMHACMYLCIYVCMYVCMGLGKREGWTMCTQVWV